MILRLSKISNKLPSYGAMKNQESNIQTQGGRFLLHILKTLLHNDIKMYNVL